MKKKVINILVMIILILATFYFLLRDQQMDELVDSIISSDKKWLFLGLICMILFICLESVIIHYIMNALSYSVKLIHCIKYSFIGFFVSAITPSSTGGQPAQMYFMKKDGISVSVSSLVLMVVTLAYKAALLILAFIMLIFEKDFVIYHIKGIEFIVFIGIVVNVIVIVALMLIIFKQSFAKRMCGNIILFLGKKRLIKNPDQKLRKLLGSISKYDRGASFLKGHKKMFFNIFFITLIQRMFYFIVTYTVYKSFHLDNNYGILTIVTLQLIITLAVDNLPWPGGIGVNEGIFMIFFTEIFTEKFVTPGLLLTRGFNYYFIILAGGIVTALAKFMVRRNLSETKENEN